MTIVSTLFHCPRAKFRAQLRAADKNARGIPLYMPQKLNDGSIEFYLAIEESLARSFCDRNQCLFNCDY